MRAVGAVVLLAPRRRQSRRSVAVLMRLWTSSHSSPAEVHSESLSKVSTAAINAMGSATVVVNRACLTAPVNDAVIDELKASSVVSSRDFMVRPL